MAECIFCGIASKKIPARIAAEQEDLVAFHDTNPQAPTHLLIVPKRHVASLNDLSTGDAELAGRILLFGVELARSLNLEKAGYRLVLNTGPDAGQTVPHLHLHLLGGRALAWPPG